MSVGSCLNMPVGLSAEKKLTMMELACCLPASVHKPAKGESGCCCCHVVTCSESDLSVTSFIGFRSDFDSPYPLTKRIFMQLMHTSSLVCCTFSIRTFQGRLFDATLVVINSQGYNDDECFEL